MPKVRNIGEELKKNEKKASALTRSLTDSLQRDPDEFARALSTAPMMNAPVELVFGDETLLEPERRLREINPHRLVRSAPGTAAALTSPSVASMAHDDVENLALTERVWGELTQRYQRGRDIVELGNLGRDVVFGTDDLQTELRIKSLQDRNMIDFGIPDEGVGGFVAGIPGATAEMLPMAWDSMKHRAVGGAVGGLGGLWLGPGALATAGTGQAIGGFISAADTEMGNAFLELRDVEGADVNTAKGLAVLIGGVNGLLEGTGMGLLLKRAPGLGPLIQGMGRNKMKRMLSDSIMRGMLSQFGERLVRGATTEMWTEMLQEGTVIAGILFEMSQNGKGLEEFEVAHEKEDGTTVVLTGLPAVWKRMIDAGIQGAQGGIGMSTMSDIAGGATSKAAKRVKEAKPVRAVADSKPVRKIKGLTQKSKLRKRNPEAYREAVEKMMEANPGMPQEATIRYSGFVRVFKQPDGEDEFGGPIEESLEAQRARYDREFADDSEIETLAEAQAVAEAADDEAAAGQEVIDRAVKAYPELADTIDDAVVSGRDLKIPYDQYATYIEGTEFAEKLAEHTTFFDEIPTPFEMSEESETEIDLGALADQVADESSKIGVERLVKRELHDKFSQIVPPGVAPAYVAVFLSQLKTRARRRSMTLKQLVLEEGLVRTEREGVPRAEALTPSVRERITQAGIERVVQDLRAGESLKSVARGTPMIQLLIDMGGIDIDSKVAAEVAEIIPRSGPGSRIGLFRRAGTRKPIKIKGKDGQADREVEDQRQPLRGLDTLVADEFPELAGIIPVAEGTGFFDERAFLEALSEEFRGRTPVRTQEELLEDQEAAEERSIIESTIADLDIDMDVLDDEDVVGMLMDELFEEDPETRGPRQLLSGERGSLNLPENVLDLRNALIRLTEASDLTTLLHEGWHLWTLQLELDALRPDAPQQVVDDWNLLREFVGAAEGESLTEENYETLARAGESYMREGRAPSIELTSVFEQFMSWFIELMRQLRFKNYFSGMELNDGLRDAMDRIIATDEQISEEQSSRGLWLELPGTLAETMTAEEVLEWNEANADDDRNMKQKLRRSLLAEEKKKQAKAWRDNKERISAEVAEEIDGQLVSRLRYWLANGSFREGHAVESVGILAHHKLSKKHLIALKGKDILSVLPREGVRLIWQRKGGYHPDAIAQAFGYERTETMLTALITAPARKDAIKARLNERMEAEFGKLNDAASLEEAVLDAVLNTGKLRGLALEERKYMAKTGNAVRPVDLIRQIARSNVTRTEIRRADPAGFRRAAFNAARQKVLLADNGDLVGAQSALRQQMFSLAMEGELRRRMLASDKSLRHFHRVQVGARAKKIKKAGRDYWEQIAGKLEQYELRNISGVRQKKRESLAEFVARIQYDEDASTVISPEMLEESRRVNWKTLTFGEIEALDDAIKNLEHLALLKHSLMVEGERRTVESIRTELITAMESNVDKIDARTRNNISHLQDGRDKLRTMTTYMDKVEFVLDRLDGREADGPWRRYLWKDMAAAAGEKNRLDQQYTKQLGEMLTSLVGDRLDEYNEVMTYEELASKDRPDADYTRMQLLAILLNMGNVQNKQRMMAGHGWTEARVMAVLNRELSKEDFKFAQGVWDLIDTLWPLIVEQERRLSGVIPDRVVPAELVTEHGTFRGGYIPIAYDRTRSARVDSLARSGRIFQDAEAQFARPLAGHQSWTKQRSKNEKGLNAPLMLDLRLVMTHIDRVLLDLTHREPLLRVDKILNDTGMRESMNAVLGKSRAGIFEPWLQHIASQATFDNTSLAGWESFLRSARIAQTTYILGGRATTLAMQPAGHANSLGLMRKRIDGNWGPFYRDAIRVAFAGGRPKGMLEVYAEIAKLSPFMRDRPGFLDRDFRDAIHSSEDLTNPSNRKITRAAMLAIAYTQLFSVDIPTWLTAYNAARDVGVKGAGVLDEVAAVDFADQMVSMSQGSARTMDTSRFQNANEATKALSLYSSYQFTVFAQVQATIHDFQQGDIGIMEATANMMFFIMIPAVYGALVRSLLTQRGTLPEEPDMSMLSWFVGIGLAELLGTVPVVRLGTDKAIVSKFIDAEQYYPSQTPLGRLARQFNDLMTPTSAAETVLDMAKLYSMRKGLPFSDTLDRIDSTVEGK